LVVGTIPAIQDQLSAAYGPRFTDLRSWLIADGLAAAGVAPTPVDAAAVEAGGIPPSLQPDGVHFTQAAYTAIGHHLASVIAKLG
jgi:lysophospholipase L1-like esterase